MFSRWGVIRVVVKYLWDTTRVEKDSCAANNSSEVSDFRESVNL